MISRRTILLLGLAIFLFAIPQAFYAGEISDCRAHQKMSMKGMTQNQGEVSFDECSMIDFGMHRWMRYGFFAGLAVLIASAVSFRSDKRNASSLTTPKIMNHPEMTRFDPGGFANVKIWLRRNPFLALGLLVAPVALIVGFISGGAGHGNYVAARLILPYACALLGTYAIVVLTLAFIQWPIYGFLVDRAKHKLWAGGAIVVAHGSLCWWLFTKGSESFQ